MVLRHFLNKVEGGKLSGSQGRTRDVGWRNLVNDGGPYLYSLDWFSIPDTTSLDNKGSSAGDMEFEGGDWGRLGETGC